MIARLLLWLIRVYQALLSPFLGGQCRFYPSCSRYAYACIEGQGAARGALLSVVRLCKCHPFHPGGFDPPPPALERDGARGGRAVASAEVLASAAAQAPACDAAGSGRPGAPLPSRSPPTVKAVADGSKHAP